MMKKIFSLFFCVLVLCMSVSADFEGISNEKIYSVGSDVGAMADVSAPTFTLGEVLSALSEISESPDVVTGDDALLTGVSRVSVPPVTPSGTSGLKASLLTVLGNYDPVVVVYQYQSSSSGYYSYATDIQPDYAWLASAALLCLVIWCLFKLGGALLRG